MNISRTLLVLAALLVALIPDPVRAAVEESQVYVIQKGDTLWGLSTRFLNDPHYWPNLWAKNPEVTNPHLIYPGQQLRVRDGKLEILPPPAEQTAQKASGAAAAKGAEVETIQEKSFTVRGNEGRLMETELIPAGRIVAGQHGRLIIGEEDIVFTDIGSRHGGSDGSRYRVMRKSAMVRHPVTNDELGYKVFPLGALQLTQVTELNSRGIVSSSFKEIEPGDLLLPFEPLQRKQVALKVASRPLRGVIVESGTGSNSIAAGDVVYLDLGSKHGVEEGNLLYIVREVNIERMLIDRYVGQLPNEVVGALVVVETGSRTSTAIVVKSIDSIFKGNEVVSAPR